MKDLYTQKLVYTQIKFHFLKQMFIKKPRKPYQ